MTHLAQENLDLRRRLAMMQQELDKQTRAGNWENVSITHMAMADICQELYENEMNQRANQ